MFQVQRCWRAFKIKLVLGVNGKARKDDVWVGTLKFTARDDDELSVEVGTLLWLRCDMVDPQTNERGELSGWYRAALFNAEEEELGKAGGEEGGRLVPSNCVRRCTTEERMQARMGRLPIWARLRYVCWFLVGSLFFVFVFCWTTFELPPFSHSYGCSFAPCLVLFHLAPLFIVILLGVGVTNETTTTTI